MAQADPTANEKDTARQLSVKAKEASASGRYPEAVELYREAHRIMHLPTTALNVATALEKIGRWVEARDFALEAMRIPPTPTEAPGQAAARKEAEALAVTLTDRIPVIDFKVQGPPPTAVEISINGTPSPGGLAVGRRLDPGPYVIELRAPGFVTASRSVVLVERERRVEPFVLAPVAPSVPAGPPTAPPGTPPPTPPGTSRTGPIVLTVIGSVVGAGGIAVGAATGVASLSQTSDLEAQCPGGKCPASLEDDLSGAETLANVSNVAFALGAAGVVATTIGVVWLATGSSSDEQASAALVVGPTTFGLRIAYP